MNLQHLIQDNQLHLIYDLQIPARISCIKPNGFPCGISLWYKFIGGKLYCATQSNSKIINYLKYNNLVAFEIAPDGPPYKGIRGEGKAEVIPDLGAKILQMLISKYTNGQQSKLTNFLEKNSFNEVAIEIIPQKISKYDYTKRMSDF